MGSSDEGGHGQDDVLPVRTSTANARSLYDRIAGIYDLLAERTEGPLRAAGLRRLELERGATAVDVGPGTGHALVELARAVGADGRVVGVDVSTGMLARARQVVDEAGVSDRVGLVCGDALRLPLATGRFDAAFMSFTLELFDTPAIPRVLAECRRVLTAAGRIVVVGMSKEGDSELAVRAYEWGHRHFPHLLDCRPIHVRRALADAGFRILSTELRHVWVPVEVDRGGEHVVSDADSGAITGCAKLLRAAIERRRELLARLHAESTDCYRLLHGVAEGRPGLTVDRYGPLLLVQTWRAPLGPGELAALGEAAARALDVELVPVWNPRGEKAAVPPAVERVVGAVPVSPVGHEMGVRYDVRPHHRGADPLLFLDLRAGRRRVRAVARDRTVLNLFAYTCGVGVAAACAGAREVWNVDFAVSALGVGCRNAALNGVADDRFHTVREDVLPVVRQLAGLPVKGRGARQRRFRRFAPRTFDLVVLDPPAWSRSPFGAVDVVRDYPSLLKPALLATRPGGTLLATHHVASVALEDWLEVLHRCARKAGRPLRSVEVVTPEEDFPSFDARPPLKMAWIGT